MILLGQDTLLPSFKTCLNKYKICNAYNMYGKPSIGDATVQHTTCPTMRDSHAQKRGNSPQTLEKEELPYFYPEGWGEAELGPVFTERQGVPCS